jgi:N-acetyl-D-muramate 6-phosphate phosphatase
MPQSVASVFFDVDGVLIDSLPQHLQICRDKATEFGLSILIPNEAEFRTMVARGAKVSPMYYFFVTVGFPHDLAQKAVEDYERDFAERYRPQLFGGVTKTLSLLQQRRIRLGLVTSNTRDNVLPILGDAITFFEPSCLFFFDDETLPKSKSWFLIKGSHLMGIRPERCLYVGDQPVDAIAALEAHFQFLGVTYGWGILDSDSKYDTVNSISEIPNWLERSTYAYRAS